MGQKAYFFLCAAEASRSADGPAFALTSLDELLIVVNGLSRLRMTWRDFE
jgi:hypothetical protein